MCYVLIYTHICVYIQWIELVGVRICRVGGSQRGATEFLDTRGNGIQSFLYTRMFINIHA